MVCSGILAGLSGDVLLRAGPGCGSAWRFLSDKFVFSLDEVKPEMFLNDVFKWGPFVYMVMTLA